MYTCTYRKNSVLLPRKSARLPDCLLPQLRIQTKFAIRALLSHSHGSRDARFISEPAPPLGKSTWRKMGWVTLLLCYTIAPHFRKPAFQVRLPFALLLFDACASVEILHKLGNPEKSDFRTNIVQSVQIGTWILFSLLPYVCRRRKPRIRGSYFSTKRSAVSGDSARNKHTS